MSPDSELLRPAASANRLVPITRGDRDQDIMHVHACACGAHIRAIDRLRVDLSARHQILWPTKKWGNA